MDKDGIKVEVQVCNLSGVQFGCEVLSVVSNFFCMKNCLLVFMIGILRTLFLHNDLEKGGTFVLYRDLLEK